MKINRVENWLHHIILIIIAVLFILPLLWMFIASIDPNAIQSVKIPQDFSLQNYFEVLSDKTVQRSYFIGFILSLGQSVIVVILSVLAAYPLSRYRTKHKKVLCIQYYF